MAKARAADDRMALFRDAIHDMLVGLLSRMHFNSQLQESLAHARSDGDLVAILLMDFDRFKYNNDTPGHQAGDLLQGNGPTPNP